jgi:transcriptional regulator with XRE-family HTH domain
MGIADFNRHDMRAGAELPGSVPRGERPLHRLHEVRRREGISLRTMARRLKTDVSTVKSQEKSTADIPLSVLYEWQNVLKVPIDELLAEAEDQLAAPVLRRAKMVRLMKTALAIRERTKQQEIRRIAQMLAEQLLDMMPELSGVGPWHAVGKRRTQEELGEAVNRRLSLEALANMIRDVR